MLRLAMVAVLLATAGCGKRSAGGQTVAIVNGDDITLSDLNLELAGVPPEYRKQAQPQILQALIDRKLLAQDAEKRGIDKSPEFILQQRRARELLLAQKAMRAAASDARQPTNAREVNDYLGQHPQIGAGRRMLLVDQLQFATPASAAKVAALKPAQTLDALAAILRAQGIESRRARAQLDTATLSDDVLAKIDALRPAEPLIALNGPNAVASAIVESIPAPIANAEGEQIARKRIEAGRLEKGLAQHGETLRAIAAISYSDAYRPKVAAAKR